MERVRGRASGVQFDAMRGNDPVASSASGSSLSRPYVCLLRPLELRSSLTAEEGVCREGKR